MEKICAKCGFAMQEDDFLCPECGAIWGAPVYQPPQPPRENPREQKKSQQKPKRKLNVAWVTTALMLLLVLAIGIALPHFLDSIRPDGPTTLPQIGPVVEYSLHIQADGRHTFENVLVQIYLGDELVHTCRTEDYGKVTFQLPQMEGYRLRFSELPAKYQMMYADTCFDFPAGEQQISIFLENKPITYTVKMVDENGQPVPGAELYFSMDTGKPVMTDADGICSVEGKYAQVGNSVWIAALPVGYLSEQLVFSFEENTNLLVIEVLTIHAPMPEGKALYTVYVIDEYGQPVANQDLLCRYYYSSLVSSSGMSVASRHRQTNSEGWFAFIGDEHLVPEVSFPNHPDYSDQVFRFVPGSHELRIQLQLHRTEFTYTVTVVNQWGEPFPGVELYYLDPKNPGQQGLRYVTDENGVITFTCSEEDPTEVVLVHYPAEGYSEPATRFYSFTQNSRKLNITIKDHSAEYTYVVKVLDQNNRPVVDVNVFLRDQRNKLYSPEMDDYGNFLFVMDSPWRYEAILTGLSDRYSYIGSAVRSFADGEFELVFRVIAATTKEE